MVRFRSVASKLWPASTAKKIAILLVLVLLASSGGFVAVSEQTGFCNSCHIMNPYYASWRQSGHSEVNCLECHVQPQFSGVVRAKLNGLAQTVDCLLGRVHPKPNALVEDVSCLRNGCHTKESLLSEPVVQVDQKYKFSHRGHIDTQLGGIRLLCSTCHSHFEGHEHFKVNTQDCFICHFLQAGTSLAPLVKTKCLDCHDVPSEVFKRGQVEIDHRKFIASQLGCEQLCHNKQIDPNTRVRDVRCLDCHEFRNQGQHDASDLHAVHNGKDKVECLACHEMTEHAKSPIDGHHTSLKCDQCHAVPFEGAKLAEIEFIKLPADCGLCHNDPHGGQFTKACQQCHSEHGWNGRWVADVHGENAAFPLAGKHESLECTRCHAGVKLAQARFVGLPRTCEQCHQEQASAMQGTAQTLKGAADFHYGRLSCTDCHNTREASQPLSEFAQKCTGCHNVRYGELLYEWAGSFDGNRARAQKALKEISGPNDGRTDQVERMMGEARKVGFHNLRLTEQLWKKIAETQQGGRREDETSLLLKK